MSDAFWGGLRTGDRVRRKSKPETCGTVTSVNDSGLSVRVKFDGEKMSYQSLLLDGILCFVSELEKDEPTEGPRTVRG